MDRERIIFVDESGRPELKGPNASDPYVITGIIAQREHELELEKIVRKFVGEGSIKSSSIRTDERRIKILDQLKALGVGYYSLVIDKSLLNRESGLRYLKSGYKFLHKLFYERLRGPSISTRIIMDSFGTSEFMQSFKPYLADQQMMFESFEFGKPKDYPGIQFADLIAGSIRLLEIGEASESIRTAIQFKNAVVEYWPPRRPNLDLAIDQNDSSNAELQLIAIESAQRYVEENLESSDPDAHLKSLFLRYLLTRFMANPLSFVFRDEITQHLLSEYGIRISRDALSSQVIAPLRSDGLLLVSTDKGVKLPYSLADYHEWVARISTQTLPNLRRLALARNRIRLNTTMQIDILDPIVHGELAEVLERLRG